MLLQVNEPVLLKGVLNRFGVVDRWTTGELATKPAESGIYGDLFVRVADYLIESIGSQQAEFQYKNQPKGSDRFTHLVSDYFTNRTNLERWKLDQGARLSVVCACVRTCVWLGVRGECVALCTRLRV